MCTRVVHSLSESDESKFALAKQFLHPAHVNPAYGSGAGQEKNLSTKQGRAKSNYAAVSAESAPALRSFAKGKKAVQPGVVLEIDGMVLDSEVGVSMNGGSKAHHDFKATVQNIKHILYRDFNFVERIIQKHDTVGHGSLPRRDFFRSGSPCRAPYQCSW